VVFSDLLEELGKIVEILQNMANKGDFVRMLNPLLNSAQAEV